MDKEGQFDSFMMKTYYDEDKYHLVAAVTAPGASGDGSWAYLKSICQHPIKLSLNRGYGPHECNWFSPPEPVDECTPTIRIAFTGEVILKPLCYDMKMFCSMLTLLLRFRRIVI